MEKKRLADLVIDGQEQFYRKTPVLRDIPFDTSLVTRLGKIITISGVRRAGKTLFLKQLADSLHCSKEQVVFMDFSESTLAEFTVHDFEKLPLVYFELYPNRTPMFFLDEIQEVADFEKGLRFLQNQGFAVFVTGSSSHLFSKDIASRMRGKTAEITVYPLSLTEFLRFKAFEMKNGYTLAERARLNALIQEYLTWGGFPEVVLTESVDTKKYILSSYLDTMLLRDVIEKHSIQNAVLMDRFLTQMITSFTKNFSVHKRYHDLKSMGFRVSKDTLYLYVQQIRETGFIHTVFPFGREAGGQQKIFLVDNGLYEVRRHGGADQGKLLENAVYNHLIRQGHSVSYYQNGVAEIDFVSSDLLVQSCWLLNEENRKRELAGFNMFEETYGTQRKRSLVCIDQSGVSVDDAVSFYTFCTS